MSVCASGTEWAPAGSGQSVLPSSLGIFLEQNMGLKIKSVLSGACPASTARLQGLLLLRPGLGRGMGPPGSGDRIPQGQNPADPTHPAGLPSLPPGTSSRVWAPFLVTPWKHLGLKPPRCLSPLTSQMSLQPVIPREAPGPGTRRTPDVCGMHDPV